MNNSYLTGKDNYPKSIDTALTMLTHYQDHRSHSKVGDSSDDNRGNTTEASFVQVPFLCHCCGKEGHTAIDCKQKKCIPQKDWVINKVLQAYNNAQHNADNSASDETGTRCPNWSG